VSVHQLRVVVNGAKAEVEVPAHRLLADLLREDLGLTGTKVGCGVGVCGACSVLVDGQLVSACLLPAVFVDGAEVLTAEGLAGDGGPLTAVQEAFIGRGGFQCGVCTPGQVVAATALLAERPRPTEGEVRGWMGGNLCRCTGYGKIVESVLAATGAREGASVAGAEVR